MVRTAESTPCQIGEVWPPLRTLRRDRAQICRVSLTVSPELVATSEPRATRLKPHAMRKLTARSGTRTANHASPRSERMSSLLPDRLWSDARHYQILALSGLLAINFTSIDFGA